MDDGTAAARAHLRAERLRAEKIAGEVHRQHRVPLLASGRVASGPGRSSPALLTSTSHAPKRDRLARGCRGRHAGRVGHVAGQRRCGATGLADQPGGLGQRPASSRSRSASPTAARQRRGSGRWRGRFRRPTRSPPQAWPARPSQSLCRGSRRHPGAGGAPLAGCIDRMAAAVPGDSCLRHRSPRRTPSSATSAVISPASRSACHRRQVPPQRVAEAAAAGRGQSGRESPGASGMALGLAERKGGTSSSGRRW